MNYLHPQIFLLFRFPALQILEQDSILIRLKYMLPEKENLIEVTLPEVSVGETGSVLKIVFVPSSPSV